MNHSPTATLPVGSLVKTIKFQGIMRHFTVVSAFVVAIALSGACVKAPIVNGTEDPIEAHELKFTASIDNPVTKTSYSQNAVLWENDDLISVNGSSYQVVEGGAASAEFVPVTGDAVPYVSSPLYKAYYPESIQDGALSAVQRHVAAGSLASVNPMYAESDNNTLRFKNICGLLHLRIQGSKTVSEIVVSNDSGNRLAGPFTLDSDYNAVMGEGGTDSVTLDCGTDGVALSSDGSDFFIALPPGEYDRLSVRLNTIDRYYTTFSFTNAAIERNSCYTIALNPQKFKEMPAEPDYFCVTNLDAGNAFFWLQSYSGPSVTGLEYSTDKENWYPYTIGQSVGIPSGGQAWLRGTNVSAFSTSVSQYNYFYSDKNVKVSGDMMTLLNYQDPPTTVTTARAFLYFFKGCTKLIDASDLKITATELSDHCCNGMFSGCSHLVSSPKQLPATKLGNSCYSGMFTNCAELTAAPETLPATIIGEYCYNRMFSGCLKLVTPPEEISAPTLSSYSCMNMFDQCEKLESAPEIAATSVNTECCNQMFEGCTALVTPPSELKATTLASKCYYQMFDNCSSLQSSPVLSGATAAAYCYFNMFANCSSLTSLPQLNLTSCASYCCAGMFDRCSSLTDISGYSLPSSSLQEYCFASMFSNCTGLTSIPSLPATTLANYCYKEMFKGCTSLEDLSGTTLPAANISRYAYNAMFENCTGLKKAPVIGATGTVDNFGCQSMFHGCSSLTDVSTLNAVTLNANAYNSMFWNCTSLVSTPKILSTTVGDNSCSAMFRGCTALTTIRQLPEHSASGTYSMMFSGCTSLTTLPTLPAGDGYNCFSQMFSGCTGFTDLSGYSLPSVATGNACFYRMFEGCTNLTKAPELSATTVSSNCYKQTFKNCSSLNTIRIKATTRVESSFDHWLDGVSSSGTIYKSAYLELTPDSVSGLPDGWNTENIWF